MGQSFGFPKDKCVNISMIDTLMTGSFTVKRTSGAMQTGWYIPKEQHTCSEFCPEWFHASATKTMKEEPVWRIFMSNSEEAGTHACGWRPLHHIEPTHLTGNQEAIDAWRDEVTKILEVEEEKRLAKQKPE